jgi:hypothetical protein
MHGRDSFLLKTSTVEVALTKEGGCLAPVNFLAANHPPVSPYAIAPWSGETLSPDIPPVIAHLRGDWFCSAFGANAEPYAGHYLPLHGESANREWRQIARGETGAGSWLRLGVELPLQGGSCEATTALLTDHSIVYQRHDLQGLTGPINPGHHATLSFPDVEGAARLSFSPFVYARTSFESAERAENCCLKPDMEITNLRSVPCLDGSTTDLSRYPARRGFDDIVIICTDPKLDIGWSAVTFPDQKFVWFALRNPKQLACTLLWFSNGGRHFPPWNGRHINVLGLEDVTAFFHVGLARSCEQNPLTDRGIRTCLEPDGNSRLSIPYIQGIARIPDGFHSVARIEPLLRGGGIALISESGVVVEALCEIDFLSGGRLSQLDIS